MDTTNKHCQILLKFIDRPTLHPSAMMAFEPFLKAVAETPSGSLEDACPIL